MHERHAKEPCTEGQVRALTIAGGSTPAAQSDCPEINAVSVLPPLEVRPTAAFSTANTCDYHVPRGGSVLFNGRIVVR